MIFPLTARTEQKSQLAFTLIELLVVIAIIAILAGMLLPALAKAKQSAQLAKCTSNLHQWTTGFHMYCDDFKDTVPEEGNTFEAINNPGTATTADNLHTAWYNVVPPSISLPSLVAMYTATNAPIPGSPSIFSCPSCADPNPTNFANYPPLKFAKAFFMFGENNYLCVNFGTIANGGGTQTRMGEILQPSATVFLGEQDPNTSTDPADSGVTSYYVTRRHGGGKLAEFSMCDGSARTARTNDYLTDSKSTTADWEWNHDTCHPTMHWFPSPTTPK